jgi:hypothetical protein
MSKQERIIRMLIFIILAATFWMYYFDQVEK